jgi:5-formyltetrahydrofolate cyclo-ligase
MKQSIREHFLKIRKKKYFELSQKNKIFIAKQINKLCNKYKINKLALYCPINYELNILSAIIGFKIKKLQTCLPVIERNNNMSFKEWKIKEPFHINRIGILEPNYKNKKINPQMILVPLVAFDKFKNRIGYGKGFYDRFFNKFSNKRNILSVGIAFTFQKTNIIPVEKHDKKLNYILTEKSIVY